MLYRSISSNISPLISIILLFMFPLSSSQPSSYHVKFVPFCSFSLSLSLSACLSVSVRAFFLAFYHAKTLSSLAAVLVSLNSIVSSFRPPFRVPSLFSLAGFPLCFLPCSPVSPEGVPGSGAISWRNSSLVRPRIIARANGSFFPVRLGASTR